VEISFIHILKSFFFLCLLKSQNNGDFRYQILDFKYHQIIK